MNLEQVDPGVTYSGTVIASTRTEPAPADEVSYTISINVEGGQLTLEGVVPQRGDRWTDYMPVGDDGEVPQVYPFPPGHRVPIHIDRQGDEFIMIIGKGEVPAFGGC